MTSPSTAILCIARNEIAYTEEWLEYHFRMGFDRVYYVSTDTDFDPITAFFDKSEFRSRVELFHFDTIEPGWQIPCYNQHFAQIKEDWVLVIDIDEFLYLHAYSSIQAYLDTVDDDVGQIQFPWLNLMTTSYSHTRTLDVPGASGKYASDHVKSMARRDQLKGLGVHSHLVGQSKTALSSGEEVKTRNRHDIFLDDTSYYQHHPFILHFCSRGYFDVIARILDHQFFNAKSGEPEKKRLRQYLTARPDWKNLPTRFLLMKFLQTLPTVDIDISVPRLTARTNARCEQEVFLHHVSRVVDFNCPDPVIADQAFEEQFRLKRKLSLIDISEHCTQDDYLECGSQLQYVRRLRNKLSAAEIPLPDFSYH